MQYMKTVRVNSLKSLRMILNELCEIMEILNNT